MPGLKAVTLRYQITWHGRSDRFRWELGKNAISHAAPYPLLGNTWRACLGLGGKVDGRELKGILGKFEL
jgi:hypothetical protein